MHGDSAVPVATAMALLPQPSVALITQQDMV